MDTEIVKEDDQAKRFRWWFLPSWLGLDAPCVVSTWTWAVSRASGTSLPIRSVAAMFLVVWLIYLSDRLIDVSLCRDWTNATGRMKFGRDFRSLFLGCLGLCIIGIFGLLLTGLPVEVIRRAMLVACGVVLHALVFVTPVIISRKLPGKEFGVGLFFALGAYACLGASKQTLPLFVSIAAVVAFNCLVIAARDADCDRTSDPGSASRWWHTMNRDLFWLGVALTAVAVLSSILTSATPFFVSVAAAFTLLTYLHHVAQRLSGNAVRALADFALFTPVVFMNPLIGMN